MGSKVNNPNSRIWSITIRVIPADNYRINIKEIELLWWDEYYTADEAEEHGHAWNEQGYRQSLDDELRYSRGSSHSNTYLSIKLQ